MSCPHCGSESRKGAQFCGDCGRSLERDASCPGCGRANPAGQRFCDGCGTPLEPEPHPDDPSRRSPRDYTPRHLADRILRSKSALEGERKQVTVLFADVKGSMELAEQVDPEEWHAILDRFFGIMGDGVHRFEGTVNQYTGDGIMALFGAPIAHEDHAQRACHAALYLTDRLRDLGQQLRRERGLAFGVRMGLNSGDVVVGKIGDDLRMDYTAQGHTVALAQRMEQLAEEGRPYLSADTAGLVLGYFALEDLGEYRVKGAKQPVRVHALQGVGALRTRLDVSRARGFSKFVGRSREMEQLEAALERARAGQPQVVCIVADAGVGKSRLCQEFLERVRSRGIRTDVARGLSHGKAIPLLALLEQSRSRYGVLETDSAETVRDKITGRMLRLDGASLDDVAFMLDFHGVPDPARPVPQLDPDARAREYLRIALQTMRFRSDLYVHLTEDLHWFDPASEVVLRGIVEALEGSRLYLYNFRPEYRAPWAGRPDCLQISLPALPDESVAELLADLLGPELARSPLAGRIRESTGGNPFFVEELILSLAEAGHLTGARGAYTLVGSPDALPIPSSVGAVLAARIDRLPEREKRVAQTAAVIGRSFSQRLLACIAGLPAPGLAESLSALVDSGLIHQSSLHPEIEYAFNHALTHDVAYGSLLGGRRRKLHRALAAELEALPEERIDERAALLAHHLEQADELAEAARWHRRAAERAVNRDPVAAIEHARALLRLSESLAPGEERDDLELTACSGLILAMLHSGRSDEEAERLFARGKRIAERLGSARGLGQMYFARGHFDVHQGGRYAEARRALRRARELGERAGDVVLRNSALYYEALALGMDDAPAALALWDELLTRLADGPDLVAPERSVPIVHLMRGAMLCLVGRCRESREPIRRGLELVRGADPLSHSFVMGSLGHHILRFDPSSVERLDSVRRAVDEAEKTGGARARVNVWITLGSALAARAEWREAEAAFEHAQELARESGLSHWAWSQQPEVVLCSGDAERAESLARSALECNRSLAGTISEGHGQLVLARALCAARGSAGGDEIERALAEAERLVEQTGAAGFRPDLHLTRAELARARGDSATFAAELAAGQGLVEQMGITGHAARWAEALAS